MMSEMMQRRALVWALVVSLTTGVGCQKTVDVPPPVSPPPEGTAAAPPPPNPAPPPVTSEKVETYLVAGVFKKSDLAEKTAVIAHEEIPGYMAAMTMPFNLKDTNEVAGLAAGDNVVFRLSVTATESWIDKLKKTKPSAVAATNQPAQREPVRLVRDVEELKVGDVVPDYRFTNELGRAISLHQFQGKALAFTFIFTRCPLPEFCPLLSRQFAETDRMLKAQVDGPQNWQLLSISFDPHFDTPEVLRTYAGHYGCDSKQWNFVTGAMIDIDAITEQFNLPIVFQNGQFDHKLRTVILDTRSRVHKIVVGNKWTAQDLVHDIVAAANVP